MKPVKSDAQSFIVRIWADESGASGERKLSGHTTNAYTKQRAPIAELADILVFIEPFVSAMGVKLSSRTRFILMINMLGRRRRKHSRGDRSVLGSSNLGMKDG